MGINDMKSSKHDATTQAKMDVIQALRKMAMSLMAEGSGEHDMGDAHPGSAGDQAVMAKLDVKKVPMDDAATGMQDLENESDTSEGDIKSQMDDSDEDEEAESPEEASAEQKDPSYEEHEDDANDHPHVAMLKKMLSKHRK